MSTAPRWALWVPWAITVALVVSSWVLPQERALDDGNGIPTGIEDAAGTSYDYRTPRSLDGALLDHCYTDLVRDDSGVADVVLSGPDRGVRLWFGPEYPYLQLFTGDTLPPDRRRQGLAAEPMTCPPDAFRTGDGLIVLEPGQTVTTTWGVAPVV